ncbi:hypothetical protein LCGC14_1950240 [marine sediment metagenome]|uniref:Uncharacterized protein n=1 Tax=marine sediment metagenome TaxID=412755 RepID=A0A0F9IEP5_9ZZZZ
MSDAIQIAVEEAVKAYLPQIEDVVRVIVASAVLDLTKEYLPQSSVTPGAPRPQPEEEA